MITRQKE